MRFVFITVLTKHPVTSILIFSSHLLLSFPSGPYPLTFCSENFIGYISHAYSMPRPFHIGFNTQVSSLFVVQLKS